MNGFMRKISYLCGVALIGLFSIGMGSTGSEDATRIPEVEESYAATIVDQSDVSMALRKISFDGRTFLMGKFGKARISVKFDKIRSVIFALKSDLVRANIRLKDGEVLEIYIEKKKPFFGEADFANVRIEVQDIKTITFQGKAPEKN